MAKATDLVRAKAKALEKAQVTMTPLSTRGNHNRRGAKVTHAYGTITTAANFGQGTRMASLRNVKTVTNATDNTYR